MVYRNPSNVVNYLTVGDDFGDICLLDKLSHFSYVCDTDVLCMFISQSNLQALLAEHYRDQLFLTRRARLRLNQLVSIKSRMVQVKRSIAENVILEFNKLDEAVKSKSSRQASRNKSTVSKPRAILGRKTSQVHPIYGSKNSIEDKLEQSRQGLKERRTEKKLSKVKENEKSGDMLLDRSDSLNPGSERKEDHHMRREPGPQIQAADDRPPSGLNGTIKASSPRNDEPDDRDPQDHPHSSLAALIKAKMGNFVVAGAAIKELQSTNAAISSGFSSKLIRATSFDRDAQNAKSEKKQILTRLLRRAEEASSLVDTAEILHAPFLEDLQTDSKASVGISKLRGFVKRISSRAEADVENNQPESSKLKKPKSRLEHSDKARKKNRLLFLARLHKAELDGSLIEDSEGDYNTRVCSHNTRTWWPHMQTRMTTGTPSHTKALTPKEKLRMMSTLKR